MTARTGVRVRWATIWMVNATPDPSAPVRRSKGHTSSDEAAAIRRPPGTAAIRWNIAVDAIIHIESIHGGNRGEMCPTAVMCPAQPTAPARTSRSPE